jgi:antitoxin CptB
MELPRPIDEPHETRLRRLRMRSWRRGMKEMDLILGPFADQHLQNLSVCALDDHERLMEENDQLLYSWISGAAPIPDQFSAAITRILGNLPV